MPTLGGIVVSTGTEASGRRIFSDMIDELARPINAADSTVRAYAADSIRSAFRTMNRKGNWPWEIQDEDVAITADERFSTVNGAVKKPLRMHTLNAAGGTRDRPIQYISYDRFLEKYSMDFGSEPYEYTIPNLFETGQIRWHPIPTSDDNARFSYYKVTPAPRNEQEAVEVPDFAIESYMSIAWLEFLKRLPSKQRPFPITIAIGQARDAFREMSAHVNSPGDRSRRISYGAF